MEKLARQMEELRENGETRVIIQIILERIIVLQKEIGMFFFAPFWFENGYRLCPFQSEIGYSFRARYTVVYEHIYRLVLNEQEMKP